MRSGAGSRLGTIGFSSYQKTLQLKWISHQEGVLGRTKSRATSMPLQDGFLIKLNGGNRESYKLALTNYNKDIRKAKWPSQQNYCGGTKNVPNRA